MRLVTQGMQGLIHVITRFLRRKMAHKTVTISEDAYAALARLKVRGESFTEVILRLTTKTRKGRLLDYVQTMKPDEELARTLEKIVKGRERTQARNAQL